MDYALSRVLQPTIQAHHMHMLFDGCRPDREHAVLGGLQISLDLSKAFDLADRHTLGCALEAAGVPNDLVGVILALHDSKKASVQTSKGIRQGCAP